MIKRITGHDQTKTFDADQHWLDLNDLVKVEVSSEDREHPIEAALLLHPQSQSGWRAAESGVQTLRILFDQPQRIQTVYLAFQEFESASTQEFLLRWSSDAGKSYRDIVRQQYNFSLPDTTAEHENYSVNLDRVTNLELTINPNISGGAARASLTKFRVK